jgi:hypothetical protein
VNGLYAVRAALWSATQEQINQLHQFKYQQSTRTLIKFGKQNSGIIGGSNRGIERTHIGHHIFSANFRSFTVCNARTHSSFDLDNFYMYFK